MFLFEEKDLTDPGFPQEAMLLLVACLSAFTFLRAGWVCRCFVVRTAFQRSNHGRERRGVGEGVGAPQRHVAVRPGDAGRGKFSWSRHVPLFFAFRAGCFLRRTWYCFYVELLSRFGL